MSNNNIHNWVKKIIPENANVIDIGAGDGSLLASLVKEKNIKAHGIELDRDLVSKALGKNLSIIQTDATEFLPKYESKRFDVALLIKTVQATSKPKFVIEEALRIAESVVIISPNFAQYKNRTYLGFKGEMPVTKQLSYAWYDTPNIHFSTLKDLVNLSNEINAKIISAVSFNKNNKAKKFNPKNCFFPNLSSEFVGLVLSKS